MKIKKNFPLKKITTLKIGGPAQYFAVVRTEGELLAALEAAKAKHLPWYIVGEGSNLVVADQGYQGVIIQIKIQPFDRFAVKKGYLVSVGAGNNLFSVIRRLNRLGLAGMEKMAGIPGTVGGAIYGCAGAYGQEIKDRLVKVKIFDGKGFRYLTKSQCRFGYRSSIFKKRKDWIILEGQFWLAKTNPRELIRTSREIVKLRLKKYPKGLQCPGSFFKNIKLVDIRPIALRKQFVKLIPDEKIMYGKVAAGYLLDAVGAKGLRQGSIRVAKHHGNLIYNGNGGKAEDVKRLAVELKSLVKRKFGIRIEEEVQYL